MKILVTGSNGLLGQKLISLISSKKEHQLIATGRSDEPPKGFSGTYRKLDISDDGSVQSVVAEIRPDVIIHGAAMTQVDDCEIKKEECWNSNVHATGFLLEASRKINAHFIFVSTDFIFDGKQGLLDEEAIPAPVNYYGESKLAAEKLVMGYPGCWAILRTVLVYGVTQDKSRSNIVLWVKNSLEAGKPIKVVNDQWRTPTLAEDLAMGCLLAAENKAQGVFNVSGAEMMTPYDIAVRTALFFNLKDELITETDSTAFKQTAARPLKTGFKIDKARKAWGYKPRTFEESLRVLARQLAST